MANKLKDDLETRDWPLNGGLRYLLNGYIKLAQARPEWIVSPQKSEDFPSDIYSCQCFEEGRKKLKPPSKNSRKSEQGITY